MQATLCCALVTSQKNSDDGCLLLNFLRKVLSELLTVLEFSSKIYIRYRNFNKEMIQRMTRIECKALFISKNISTDFEQNS